MQSDAAEIATDTPTENLEATIKNAFLVIYLGWIKEALATHKYRTRLVPS
jgi:hypothetical protein